LLESASANRSHDDQFETVPIMGSGRSYDSGALEHIGIGVIA
jgi:hypothetical protein